ncbi:MAG: YgiQ family radical SAM protein [Phycisphaerae bacterium]|nr:YgiQ family radical SAM protein [Phycisphaerae bacterium]
MSKLIKRQYDESDFLPMTAEQLKVRRWQQPDIILVTGDAYVDHPSFGVALIGRFLESHGYKVAILAQPNWQSVDDFRALGKPRLFWGITSGAVDSRLNEYASMGHKRRQDVYSPAGKTGLRPGRPLLVYSQRARQAYKDVPIVLGGLEASLRRLVHYDFIEDNIKRSVLTDAKADILVHGMGETAILEIARRLEVGENIREITNIAGTAVPVYKDTKLPEKCVELSAYENIKADSKLFMTAWKDYQKQCNPQGLPVLQDQGSGKVLVNPPAKPLTIEEMDALYELKFTRCWHPSYDKLGGIAALEPVKFSITSHRGCFGGCSFCSIFFHQGKYISCRSQQSIIDEIERLSRRSDFNGTINDIGGPTANMYGMYCKQKIHNCSRPSCIYPDVCKNLNLDYSQMLGLMDKVMKFKKHCQKKLNVYIASGVRHDLALHSKKYIELLAGEFVGGHLKVAPEHYSDKVLKLMGKSGFNKFEEFEKIFDQASKKAHKKQYLVPYFISSHPGCSDDDALDLTEYLVARNWRPRQVQDFVPVPMSLSAAMYVSHVDADMKKIYVSKGHSSKRLQMALLQYYDRKNYRLIADFLKLKHKSKLLSKIDMISRRHNRD